MGNGLSCQDSPRRWNWKRASTLSHENSWDRRCGVDAAFSNFHAWLHTTGVKPPVTHDLARLLLLLRAFSTFAVQSSCSRSFERSSLGEDMLEAWPSRL